MQDALRLAGAAAGIKDEQRVFGVHDFGLAAGAGDGQPGQVVIPVIAAFLHVHRLAGAADDDDMLHDGRAAHGGVHHFLEGDDLAAQPGPIAGDHHAAFGVVDAVGQGLLAEAAVDHAVGRAQLGAGQHGDHQFRDAAHVDRHAVAFFDAHALEDVGEAVHLLPQPPVAHEHLVAVFALPDDGQLVLAPGFDVAIKGVVDDIGLGPHEPLVERRVAVVEDFVPHFVPFQRVGAFGPERQRILNGFVVNVLIIGDVGVFDDIFSRVIPLPYGWGKSLIRHTKSPEIVN